jgi:hypothetical protein
MPRQIAILLTLVLLPSIGYAKKKKDTFPALILKAQYVCVFNDPDAGLSLDAPAANRNARADIESAIEKWGRYKLTASPENADLIIVVHRGGKNVTPTIGVPGTDSPVILGQGGDMNVGIGVGRRPPLSSTEPTTAGPRMEMGSGDDVFSIYRGGTKYPLDAPPLWRYAARNALQHPTVPAYKNSAKQWMMRKKPNRSSQRQSAQLHER